MECLLAEGVGMMPGAILEQKDVAMAWPMSVSRLGDQMWVDRSERLRAEAQGGRELSCSAAGGQVCQVGGIRW